MKKDILYSSLFIHPLWIPLILIRVAGRWSRSHLTLGKGRVHPGQAASPSQGSHRDRQPFTLTFTPTGNLEINEPAACLWTVGGSQREPTLPRGEHANSTQKDRPSCCEATVLATTPPCNSSLVSCFLLSFAKTYDDVSKVEKYESELCDLFRWRHKVSPQSVKKKKHVKWVWNIITNCGCKPICNITKIKILSLLFSVKAPLCSFSLLAPPSVFEVFNVYFSVVNTQLR